MPRAWEIRGLFGNEYAMEGAVEELKKHAGFEWVILDRRNLSVRFGRRDEDAEKIVKRTIDIFHGWVESEAPLGEFDAKKEEAKRKKAKDALDKQKRAAKTKKH